MQRRPHLVLDARLAYASGIGVYIRNLFPRVIRALEGWRCTVLVRPGDGAFLQELPAVALVETDASIYGAVDQWRLASVLPKDADLFWTPHYVLPVMARVPVIATVHDVAHLVLPQFRRHPHRLAYARAMFALLRRRAKHIFCDSAFTRDELVRLVGVPSSRISVSYLGIADSWLTPRVVGESPSSNPYLLYVGNVKPHKNLGRLLDAFDGLLSTIPHDLVIVGRSDGFITADGKVHAKAERIGPRVRFTGEVSDTELRRLYADAQACILPSLYEGFGLPPLEAMASGTPVVVSRTASLPEICGEAAEYCDPLDVESIRAAILRVATSPARRAELRALGFSRVRRFKWEDTTRTVVARLRAEMHALDARATARARR